MADTKFTAKEFTSDDGDIGVQFDTRGYQTHEVIVSNLEGSCSVCHEITHLIAAAPDLYAVLDEINTWCGTDEGAHYLPFEPPWYTNLRAALAKARGEQ